MDSDTSWRIGTTPDCDDTLTVLEGVVGGDGSFMMAGHHELSDTRFVIQGKVKFANGTLTPVSISDASVLATSDDQAHYGTGKFHTVGPAFPNSCP